MSASKWSLLAVLGLVSCSPSSLVFVETPALGESRSVFVAIDNVLDFRVFVLEADDGRIQFDSIDVDPDRAVTVEMVGVAASLDALRLVPGELESKVTGDVVTLPIEQPVASYATTIEGGTAGEWNEGEPSARLRGFSITNPAPCPTLKLVTREELDVMSFAAIVSRPDLRLFIRRRGETDQALLVNSTFDDIETDIVDISVAFTHGAIATNDDSWVADDTHAWPATIRERSRLVAGSTVALPVADSRAIAVDDWTVYTQGRNGEFWRVPMDGPPERLGTLEDTRGRGLFIAPMAATPGKVVTGNSNSNQTLIYENGTVTDPPRLPANGVRALRWVPGMSTFVAGTIDGTLYRLVGDIWELLVRPAPDESQVRALTPIGDGFVYVSGDTIGLYQGGRFCPEQWPGSDVRHLSSVNARMHALVDGDPDVGRRAVLEVRGLEVQ